MLIVEQGDKMRNVMLKHTLESKGRLSLQQENVKVGMQGRVCNILIKDVPNDITTGEVISLASTVCFMSGRFEALFSELSIGRILW
jgi:hypothetical protein